MAPGPAARSALPSRPARTAEPGAAQLRAVRRPSATTAGWPGAPHGARGRRDGVRPAPEAPAPAAPDRAGPGWTAAGMHFPRREHDASRDAEPRGAHAPSWPGLRPHRDP